MNKLTLFGASLFALMSAAPAAAQTAAPQPDATSEGSDEIIVTATLRNENLQDVPIAVTAFGAESLDKAGVKDIKGLDSVSASFNMSNSQSESGGTTLRIRGVGTTGNNTGLESAVGIFLDGVYLSRPGIALGDLLDVQQVELLRGPQGTLFGRNTSAGALSIKTAKPNLNKFEGFANASYGNYDLINVQGGVSAPLIDGVLGVRLSGAYRKQDGTIKSTTGAESNNKDRYIIRGQAYWEPSADISVRLIADYSKSDEKCCDAIIIRDSSIVAAGLYTAVGLPANGGVSVSGPQALRDRISNGQQFFDEIKQYGVSSQLDWDLGGANLVYISSYRNSRSASVQESDFVGANVFSTSTGSTAAATAQESFTRIKTFSQELRISGSALGDKLQYLVGGYYSDEKINEIATLTLGNQFQQYTSASFKAFGVPGANPALTFAQGVNATGNFATNQFRQTARNLSLFTNNTFDLTDRFKFNFGLRYSDDRKKGSFDQLAANAAACNATLANPLIPAALRPLAVGQACFPFAAQAGLPGAGTASLTAPPTPAEFSRTFKDNELIYTAKLLWEPSDQINTYLSYSHGYKSGGFNLDPTAASTVGGVPGNPAFKSEKVNSYEFGIKTKLLDNALTANLAIFHQDLSDFQVLEFTGVQFITFNVDKAKSTGGEVELNAKLSRAFSVNGSYTYTDARYPKNCNGTSTAASVVLLCGQTLTNAPKHVVIAGFNLDQDIGSSLNFGLNGSIRMESDRRTSTQALIVVGGNRFPNPLDVQDGNAKVNLRAAVGSQSGAWRIEFWGNNIFDVQTRSVTANTPLRGGTFVPGALGAAGAGLSRIAFLQEPATYGVTVRTKF